jgi:hypothetical protein
MPSNTPTIDESFPVASKAHQFSLYTDAIYAHTGDTSSTGVTLCLGWQYF